LEQCSARPSRLPLPAPLLSLQATRAHLADQDQFAKHRADFNAVMLQVRVCASRTALLAPVQPVRGRAPRPALPCPRSACAPQTRASWWCLFDPVQEVVEQQTKRRWWCPCDLVQEVVKQQTKKRWWCLFDPVQEVVKQQTKKVAQGDPLAFRPYQQSSAAVAVAAGAPTPTLTLAAPPQVRALQLCAAGWVGLRPCACALAACAHEFACADEGKRLLYS